MVKFLGELELVEVKVEDHSADMTFLYEELGEIREVRWYIDRYEDKKWVKSDEQREKFENNCESILKIAPDKIEDAVGNKYAVWEGEKYCYLWEPQEIEKFEADMVGQILNAEIVEINEYEAVIQIKLNYEDKIYQSKMNFGKWIQAMKKSLPDPQKKQRQLEKFEEKFHVPFDEKDSLIGTSVMIEVKKNNMDSTGKNPTYIEIKALPKKK